VHTRATDIGLLIIRVVLGVIMVAHGSQKLFTYGLAGVTGSMGQMGLPAPQVSALLITAAEFGGGLLLIAGLLTRVAAAAVAFGMSVATVMVHLPNGFFAPTGYEFTLMLAGAALGLVFTGAGCYSIDHLIARARHATHHHDYGTHHHDGSTHHLDHGIHQHDHDRRTRHVA
jgi:putative oxidoreductase